MSKEISKKFRNALFQIGHILPRTTDEINQFQKILKKNELSLYLSDLPLPSEIIKQRVTLIGSQNKESRKNANKNMARAAREGKDLSEEILAKMKKDRQDAEKKK